MRYQAQVKVFENQDLVFGVFLPEQRQLSDVSKVDRLCFEIQGKADHVVFDVMAADPVALRAVLNSITKGLTVMNKMAELV